MNPKELHTLSDQELLQVAKKQKSAPTTNAIFIGFLAGIIIYSILKNSLGFFTIIPLFIIYKLINTRPYDKTEVKALLKERKLNV